MTTISRLNWKVQLAFWSAISTLVLVGAVSYRGIVASSDSERWVSHTHEVLENLQDLVSAMVSAESSYRGFVLTGDESAADAYRTSALQVRLDETEVRKLTADNAEQQRRLSEMERLVAGKFQFADSVISLRRSQGGGAAADAIRTGLGIQLMAEFQEIAREMRNEETRLLLLRDAESKRRLRQAEAVLLVGILLGMSIAFATGWSFQLDSSARGRAEALLRDSEEKYRMLVEGVLGYAIFMLDPEGRVVSWNAGAERIKGYTAEQIMGQNFSVFFTPEDRKLGRPEEVLRMTTSDGRHQEYATRVRKDGTEFPASITLTALLDNHRGLRGFSEISNDLSESKSLETKYRALLEAAPDAMVVVNQREEIVLLNAQVEKQFGYRRDELLGQKVETIIPSGFAERLVADALRTSAEALAQRIGTGIELIGRRKDGSVFPIEIMLSPLENAEGILVTAAIRDITARRLAEHALLKSEESFSKAFRSSPLPISIATQAEGRYLDVNDALINMLGYKREQLIGRTSAELNFWEDPSQRVEMLRWLGDKGRVTGLRTQFVTATGEIRDADVSAELIEIDGQSCVLAITRDITETLRLEAQFRQAQKMEAVGRLAGGVAHDFNNLLGVILGYSDLALDVIAPESPVNRHLEQIKKASNRAVALTRQLLAFSRQEVVFTKILDLNEVVQNLTTMLQRLVGEDIDMSFRPVIPIGSIKADPGQVEQVLMNLVVNARDAMPGSGKIIIETRHADLDEHYVSHHPGSAAGRYVVLSVSDTGCGIDEKIKSQIFEPFFTTKEIGRGTGLGLSTVYGIVKQSGGTIFVYSELDKGTSFKIYFPRVAGEAEQIGQLLEEIDFPGGSETVLVVEDDLSLRALAVTILQDAGYRVMEAENAQIALEILQDLLSEIDLLLTDVIMPGKSGVELLEEAKLIRPNLRALFVSGYTGDLFALRGGVLADHAFLEKPFTRNSLLKRVRLALHNEPVELKSD
jgi:PAS domain S-box-containing protein